MRHRCEPLYAGDPNPCCGEVFDDLYQMAVCPHPRFSAGGGPIAAAVGPTSWRPPTTEAERHVWDMLVEHGVIARVEQMWDEDDTGVIRDSISIEDFIRLLDEKVPGHVRMPEGDLYAVLNVTGLPVAKSCLDDNHDGDCPSCVIISGPRRGERFMRCPKLWSE